MSPLLRRFDPDHLEVLRQSTHDLVLRHPLWRPSVPRDAHHTNVGKQRPLATRHVRSLRLTAQSDHKRSNCAPLSSQADRPVQSTRRSSHRELQIAGSPKEPATSRCLEDSLRDKPLSLVSNQSVTECNGDWPAASANSVVPPILGSLRKTNDFPTGSFPCLDGPKSSSLILELMADVEDTPRSLETG